MRVSHGRGNPRGENNQKIGHNHVGENHICGSHLAAKQDRRDVVKQKDDIGHRSNSYLYKIRGFQGCLACGSQGIFVKRHGEDARVSWNRKEAVLMMTSAVFLQNQHWKRILKIKKNPYSSFFRESRYFYTL